MPRPALRIGTTTGFGLASCSPWAIATGGTLVSAIEFLAAKGATDITAICILAAPEGIAVLEKAFSTSKLSLKLVTGALDERLNEKCYIIPGLGYAGDRLYGVV